MQLRALSCDDPHFWMEPCSREPTQTATQSMFLGYDCWNTLCSTRWELSLWLLLPVSKKRPEAECLFAFPKMTLSPITCEQRGLDSLLQMEHVRGWGLALLDPARTYRYCLLTAHIAASAGGGWRGGERGAGHRRRRLKFHCKQKPDPETWIGSFHSCPNTRSVSAEILSTRSHRSRESC